MWRKIKRTFLFLFIAVIIAGIVGITQLNETIRPVPSPLEVASFTEVPTGVVHQWNQKTHPFTGAAVIDATGDGRPEIFVGGGEGQDDWLLAYEDGKFRNIISSHGISSKSATHGATAIDMDRDGDTDLVVARNDGITIYLNEAGSWDVNKVELAMGADEVPFSVAVGDVNNDGHADLYVSVFISFPAFRSATFNDAAHAKKNRLLVNNGNMTFTDVTASSGTAGRQNTFTSAFVDLDNDGRQDLILSQNTGEVEIFQNLGQATFKPHPTNTGYGFWMGLGAGDIDNDGDQDLFFSNLGVSIPAFLTKGDLKEGQRHAPEWLLLRNDGNFRFTDVTREYGLHGYGFSWGAVFEDFNLDGRLDLAVAQNYIKWPLHKVAPLGSKTFLQQDDGGKPGFYQYDALGLDNRYFAQSPLVADIDGDGRPDFFWLNMDGPFRAFLNSSKRDFLAVSVPDDLAFQGASVMVETEKGKLYTRQVMGSIGLLTDQSATQFFGLDGKGAVKRVTLTTSYGKTYVAEEPGRNRVLQLEDFAAQ